MIEVFDTAAASIALARRKLGCPDCGQPLRPWGTPTSARSASAFSASGNN